MRRPARTPGPTYAGQPAIVVRYRFDPDGPWYQQTTWTPQEAARAARRYHSAGAVEVQIVKESEAHP